MFVRGFLFRAGVTHPERLTAQVRRAYLAPHPDWASRTAMLAFPRQIPSGPGGPVSDLAGRLEDGLRRYFAARPVAIAWGMKDPAFTPRWLDLWLQTFPRADVLRLPDAGHYLQEDAHEAIIPALLRLLSPPHMPAE
jgi:cis-3-alkyl-4-acyloxetan-2-one decarboxylase